MIYQPARILIIKLRAIGDVVMATPVIENLRAQFPEAHIAFLTEDTSAEIIEDNSFLDEVIVIERRQWKNAPFLSALKDQLQFYRTLHAKKFDLVFDLFGNPRSAVLSLISGAPTRVGFNFRFRRFCYTKVVTPRGGEVHEVEFNLDALKALDIPIVSRQLRMDLSEEAIHAAQNWINSRRSNNNKIIGLNPGGGWQIKRWPPAYFAELADELVKLYDVQVLLFWGPGEEQIVDSILRLTKEKIHLVPDSTLKELGGFISCCHLIISNDSGPMHMATALKIPTIGIYGPTNPELQGPYGAGNLAVRQDSVKCLGCNQLTCKLGNICMTELPASEILKHTEVFLK
jgi:lipopolysaccharide heptosyltransferase I